jgi:L-ascorbate metabolism protein UlaG (beta-lactamase superfamily)
MKRREFLITTLFGTVAMNIDYAVRDMLKTIQIPDSFFTKREDTLFTWLGMAGVLINCRGTVIFIDPLISYGADKQTCETGNRLLIPLPLTADKVPVADFVCYTHADSDHFSEKSAKILNSRLCLSTTRTDAPLLAPVRIIRLFSDTRQFGDLKKIMNPQRTPRVRPNQIT